MSPLLARVHNSWLTRSDLDYHLIRTAMVIIFLLFGYQKWFDYEAKVLRSCRFHDLSRISVAFA